ncbi:MAG: bifunctional diguanylate cyclase/phosphodiesterase [Halioglobus sp.]
MPDFPDLTEIARHRFFQALEEYVHRARDDGSNVGLLLIDITNLGKINHNFGFSQGDLLLSVASEKLLSVSKLPDTVFRIGSHHFGFILPGLSNPGFIALAINKVATLLGQDITVGEESVPADINIGIAICRKGDLDSAQLLAIAETSLASVRRGGEHQFDGPGESESVFRQDFQLERQFRDTLQDNEFSLYYQPKINLRSGAADHAEALLRWQLESGEFVPPDQLVELADSMGSGFALTKWVIHTGIRQLTAWRNRLDMSLALNVQASLVSNPDLHSLLEDTIAIWGAEESRITLEITESAIIDDKESGFDNLLNLTKLGVDLSIDDFGTGYSSMAYFKHIPASELKIDRYFVSSMKDDHQDRELVRIMIDTAHLFGMRVVAEGVEDQESLDILQEMGCDYAQGYFFTKPLPAPEFEQWVNNWQGL